MSLLTSISTCCICLSIWAIIQLCVMGGCFMIEMTTLIEDVHAHDAEYKNYDDFIKVTEENYYKTAINCWATAGIYCVTLLISCLCLIRAKRIEKRKSLLLNDDEYICSMQREQREKEMARESESVSKLEKKSQQKKK